MARCALSQLTDHLKVLANPMRLRILALLRHGELCVCQIVSILGIANSTVSEHLQTLRQAGFIVERRDGRWVHYSLVPEEGLQGLVDTMWPYLDAAGRVNEDYNALKGVRQESLEDTCAKTRSCRMTKKD